eukprot:SAG31_NODE_95_length_25901_cov_24.763700_38_plen_64_part_00
MTKWAGSAEYSSSRCCVRWTPLEAWFACHACRKSFFMLSRHGLEASVAPVTFQTVPNVAGTTS